jgi:hypothetical protein
VRHVRGTGVGAAERDLLRRALAAAVSAENEELVAGAAG